jgi:hypothetical protein
MDAFDNALINAVIGQEIKCMVTYMMEKILKLKIYHRKSYNNKEIISVVNLEE